MEASPAPMTILQASRVQKLLAKPQPTDDTIKMAMPHPVITPQTDHMRFEQLVMLAGMCTQCCASSPQSNSTLQSYTATIEQRRGMV